MRMEDDVDAPYGVDLDSNLDMDRDGDDEEDNEEKEDSAGEDEEEEDEDEDDGKEPQTIGQGEKVNTSADIVDTMVDDQPMVFPEQGKEMREYTPWPHPLAPATQPQTLEPRAWPRTAEADPLSGLEILGLVTPQKPRPAVPTLREADAARYPSEVDVDQQRLSESADGDSLCDVLLPKVHWPYAHPDFSVGMECTSPHISEKAMVFIFRLGSGSCLVCLICCTQFMSGIDFYTHREVFGSFGVDLCYWFCIHSISFLVLRDITHAPLLQLLASKQPPCDGIEAQWISQVSWKYCELIPTPGCSGQAPTFVPFYSVYSTPHVSLTLEERRPPAVAPNFHAERSSPQRAGHYNISMHTTLNTFRLHARRIWLFAARPNPLNPLSVVNSTLAQLQSKAWTCSPTSNTLTTSQTRSLNHRNLLRHGQEHTLAPVLRSLIALLCHGNAMHRDAFRQTYNTIPTTRLRTGKSTNISSVRSRRRAWRRTMSVCWRMKTPVCISQASNTVIESRSLSLACQMIRLLGSWNYTLSRIWDGMTITNALSNTRVETLSLACDGWCGSQPIPSIFFTPLSVALTATPHWNTSIPKYTVWTGDARHR